MDDELADGEDDDAGHEEEPAVAHAVHGEPDAENKSDFTTMFVEEVVKEIEMLQEPKSVCITGGEPLDQKVSLMELITQLIAKEYHISLETNGTLSIPLRLVENNLVKIVMDIKCPSSGVDIGKDYAILTADNLAMLRPGIDEVKFVVATPEDFSFMQLMSISVPKGVTILISPIWEQAHLGTLADWIKASQWPWGKDVRMQLQMHKIIWPPEKRGV